MMKLAGAVMVFLGCLGMALLYISRQNTCIRRLEELQEMLEHMEEEIRYSKTSLPECFLGAGNEQGNYFAELFRRVGARALDSPQEELKSLLQGEFSEALSEILPPTEESLFYDFVSAHSFREEGMQVRSFQRSRKRIADYTEALKREQRGKCRVALSLGAMGGLFLIVLLV